MRRSDCFLAASVTVNISFLFRLIINKTLCLLQIYHFNGIATKDLNKEISRLFVFWLILSLDILAILNLLA
jgi:hypothetical protein